MNSQTYYLCAIIYFFICAMLIWAVTRMKKRRDDAIDDGKPIIETLAGPLLA
jgi:hypothetical protein